VSSILSPQSDSEQIRDLQKRLYWAEMKIQLLEEQLRLERIEKYGPGSEKLSSAQLELLELEPGVSGKEVEAESNREPLPAAESANRPKKHPGRQELPGELTRVERVLPSTPEQCSCKACGRETVVIGYEQSEQLDVKPAEYFVLVTKREKRVCKRCEEGGVATAPLPARIIDKSLASDQVIINTVISKYCDHVPLYRQSAILERDTGIEIGRATLDGWVMRVGELLVPIASAMRLELLDESYIQADETPVGVQTHDKRGKNHRAYLWQYGRPGGNVVFDFQMGRGREGPVRFLGQFEGILQSDGYAAYERVGGPQVVHACCWSHSRRKFFDAAKLHPDDRVAAGIVTQINALFAIDAEARGRNLNQTERHALRQQQARPLLAVIRKQVESAQASALPASALGKAATYTLALWRKLNRFLDHPELELSNNLAENSMRPLVVGRKNWIHIGSQQAGPKVAAILSVVETCRRLKLSVRDYLAAVLPALSDRKMNEVKKLTPLAHAASL
jgi:transposase